MAGEALQRIVVASVAHSRGLEPNWSGRNQLVKNSIENSAARNAVALLFNEYAGLASRILPFAVDPATEDGAHDLSHIARVWSNAKSISGLEGGDREILAAAVVLHDCVCVEKNSPLRGRASRLAAERAAGILGDIGWRADRCAAVAHAIEAHSFSAAIEPLTLEACILQDADRLDAIGLIGVARCFYTAGRMGTQLYSVADPGGRHRQPDDSRFALDHFPRKLLGLCKDFRTKSGSEMAEKRHRELMYFYDGFISEVGE